MSYWPLHPSHHPVLGVLTQEAWVRLHGAAFVGREAEGGQAQQATGSAAEGTAPPSVGEEPVRSCLAMRPA